MVIHVILTIGAAYGFIRLIADAIRGEGIARWLIAWPWGWISELRKLEQKPCTCATVPGGPCPRHG